MDVYDLRISTTLNWEKQHSLKNIQYAQFHAAPTHHNLQLL